MDIQWVMLARGHKVNTDKTIDIYGICHHFTRIFGLTKAPIELIAKVISNPLEAGTQKEMTLTVTHMERGVVEEKGGIYNLPSFRSWGTETPYIYIPLNDIELAYEGEYIFALSFDGEYKNEEHLKVR